MHAGHMQALVAEGAGAIGIGEGHDDQIADFHGANLGPDRFHDADGFVSHPQATFGKRLEAPIRRALPQMQVRATRMRASLA